jgi:OmpA-OmpF porin, OOP family
MNGHTRETLAGRFAFRPAVLLQCLSLLRQDVPMRRALLAASVLFFPLAATAQPIAGLYVGAGGGANFLEDQRIRGAFLGSANVTPPGATTSFRTGYVGLGSVGWGFGNGVRVEIEGSYRANDVDSGASVSGKDQSYGAMANALFDLDIGSPYVFPYLGAGAGDQFVHATRNGPGLHLSDTVGSFAYQAMAGASFPIPGVVGLSVTAEYRFLGMAGERKFKGTSNGVPFGIKMSDDNNHSLLLGVRYAFDVTPPAAPAAPVPAPAAAPVAATRSYLVFFDWDKADLTARAQQVVTEAAQASTRVQYTRIEVAGHADKTGTPAYNMALSRRRADNVAAELVRQGVPKAAIDIQAFGETRPLVPTADGVREPQNRRVEIVLR